MLKSKSFLQIFFSCLIVIAVGVLIVKAATTIGTNISTDGNLTVSGTITQGTWNGSTIGVAYGGTASTTLSGILKGNGTGMVATAVADTDYLLPATAATLYAPLASPTFTGLTTLANATSSQLTTTGSTYLATVGGNVGIGTTTPNTDLNIVRNNAIESGLRVDQTGTGMARVSLHVREGGGDAYIGFGTDDANGASINRTWHMGVDNSAGEPFVISGGADLSTRPDFFIDRDSGHVGLGFPATATNTTKLLTLLAGEDGDGLQIRRGATATNSYATIGFRFTTTEGADHAQIQGIRTDSPGSAASALAFLTRDGSNLLERMRIDGNGNVGIGTSTPSSLFTASAGANATTTVEFGDQYSANSKSCFNVKTSAGANASFYFNASGIVFETNRCR